MASYTITTTALQDAAIALRLEAENARRLQDGQPSITAADLINRLVESPLAQMVHHYRASERDRVSNGYEAASPAVRTQIRTLLGL